VLGPVKLSTDSFAPSESAPALLTFAAGRVVGRGALDAIQPIDELRLDLVRDDGTELGTFVTLRDLLPGRYAFGLTGRTPAGNRLSPGSYRIRVIAYPSLGGRASTAQAEFTIK